MSSKVTKEYARYVDQAPKGAGTCNHCTMYRAGTCTYVLGSIRPGGHCRFFKHKPGKLTGRA